MKFNFVNNNNIYNLKGKLVLIKTCFVSIIYIIPITSYNLIV